MGLGLRVGPGRGIAWWRIMGRWIAICAGACGRWIFMDFGLAMIYRVGGTVGDDPAIA